MKCNKEKSLKNVWFKKTEQVNKITIKKIIFAEKMFRYTAENFTGRIDSLTMKEASADIEKL